MIKRERLMVSAEIYMDAQQKLNVNQTTLDRALGYKQGAGSKWIKDNKMPLTASLACEALLRRNNKPTATTVVLIVRCPTKFREAVVRLVESMDCEVKEV